MNDAKERFNAEQAKHPIPCLNCGEDTVLMHMLWHTQRRHLATSDFRCNLMVKVEGDAKCETCSNWGAGVGGGGCCPDCAGVKG
jgi:hypothetical protein